MPKYAVDFIADIEVVKFDKGHVPIELCKENSCQTDNVNKNAYQTGMGNIQCLVTCTDQAHGRKVLVSRGIQCQKVTYHKECPQSITPKCINTKIPPANTIDVSSLSKRPCVSGVNLQSIKDGIRQESTQIRRSSTDEQKFLKRKRDLLLGNLQLIENGEEADVDSLSDTLSNTDVKVELQQHLSEFHQLRIENIKPTPCTQVKYKKEENRNHERETSKYNLPISQDRGDMCYEQNRSNMCSSETSLPFGSSVTRSTNRNSRIPTGEGKTSTPTDNYSTTDINPVTAGSGDRKPPRTDKCIVVYNESLPQHINAPRGRGFQTSSDFHNELHYDQTSKASLNECNKSCAGDMGDGQPNIERPPVHPSTKTCLPMNVSIDGRRTNPFQNDHAIQYSPQRYHSNKGTDVPSLQSLQCHSKLMNDTQQQTRNQLNISRKKTNGVGTSGIPPVTFNRENNDCQNRNPEKRVRSNTPQTRKPQLFNGKSITQRFYIPESANIEKILSDHSDRRIKAICDRNHCDIEVYSRAPRSGFMKNVMILTAPTQESLKKCVRSLDCSFKWCISSQLK